MGRSCRRSRHTSARPWVKFQLRWRHRCGLHRLGPSGWMHRPRKRNWRLSCSSKCKACHAWLTFPGTGRDRARWVTIPNTKGNFHDDERPRHEPAPCDTARPRKERSGMDTFGDRCCPHHRFRCLGLQRPPQHCLNDGTDDDRTESATGGSGSRASRSVTCESSALTETPLTEPPLRICGGGFVSCCPRAHDWAGFSATFVSRARARKSLSARKRRIVSSLALAAAW